MFGYCDKKTVYYNSYIDFTYAMIDISDYPGYFTLKD